MVMQNTFQSCLKSDCVLKFDLKGSTVARHVQSLKSEAIKKMLGQAKSENQFFEIVQIDRILKDVNFANLNRILQTVQKKDKTSEYSEDPEGIIRLSDDDLEHLMSCLEKDTLFLQNLDIMDYSLLLVVEHLKQPLPKKDHK